MKIFKWYLRTEKHPIQYTEDDLGREFTVSTFLWLPMIKDNTFLWLTYTDIVYKVYCVQKLFSNEYSYVACRKEKD